jgi:transcriptional regulator with XRE-family HTH domain
MSVFSDKLIELRTAAQMSQGELARRIGLTRQAISSLEADRNAPDWATVQRIAVVLGVSAGVFADPNIPLPEVQPKKAPGRPRKATAEYSPTPPPSAPSSKKGKGKGGG